MIGKADNDYVHRTCLRQMLNFMKDCGITTKHVLNSNFVENNEELESQHPLVLLSSGDLRKQK